MNRYFAIQQAERTADIYIFGDIVPFAFFEGDVSAHSIVQQIQALDVDTIRVHIDSYGGAVSEGWAIYNALREHPAKIVTYGDGFVASAALYPFLAGDERYASNLSAYFFHQVMTGACGYAKDLRAAADEADVLTEIGMAAFTERAGMSEDTVRQLMENETWLSPQQALEHGVATAIVSDATPKLQQNVKKMILQQFTGQSEQPPAAPAPKAPEAKPIETKPNIMQLFKL